MARKAKPKVTITKENYDKLKEDQTALKILRDCLGNHNAASDSEAILELRHVYEVVDGIPLASSGFEEKLCALKKLACDRHGWGEQLNGILWLEERGKGCQLADMRDDPINEKIERLRQLFIRVQGVAGTVLREYGVDDHGAGYGTGIVNDVRGAIRKLEQDRNERLREVKNLRHRNRRLKDALRSSLHTTAAVADVIGQFEEENGEETE